MHALSGNERDSNSIVLFGSEWVIEVSRACANLSQVNNEQKLKIGKLWLFSRWRAKWTNDSAMKRNPRIHRLAYSSSIYIGRVVVCVWAEINKRIAKKIQFLIVTAYSVGFKQHQSAIRIIRKPNLNCGRCWCGWRGIVFQPKRMINNV